MAEIVKSRSSVFLHIEGHLYYKHSGRDRRYWFCRNKDECSARAITTGDGDNLTVIKGPDDSAHTHAPNIEEVQALQLIRGIKRAAEDHPEMPPAQILRRELQAVPAQVLAEMPDRPNLRRHITRVRRRNFPANPIRMTDLGEVPDQYTRTLGGEKFLLYDSIDDEDHDKHLGRIVIFATAENLRTLFQCESWTVDGTFKMAPTIFLQLFSILGTLTQPGHEGDRQQIGLPLVYALLENKRQSSYTKVLNIVLQEGRKMGFTSIPEKIMSDFEISIINAAFEVFGEDVVKCCFFHLSQSVYRHVVDEGLKRQYKYDLQLKEGVHSLCSLASVPVNDVEEHFVTLRDALPADLGPVADYFEATYIRRFTTHRHEEGLRIVRHPPRYPPALWNHYDSVLEKTARTSNISESWHNRFHIVVGKHHPSLYVFMDELKKEQADTETMLIQLRLGQRIKRGTQKKRREIARRVRHIVRQYDAYENSNDILTYLKNVGYYVKM